MTDFLEGAWRQPRIRIDLHEPACCRYHEESNTLLIDRPDCDPEFFVIMLSHQLTRWAQFVSLDVTDWARWLKQYAADPFALDEADAMLELAALWSVDCPPSEYVLFDAQRRRSQRIIVHRDGTCSWRPMARRSRSERLSAVGGGA